MLCLSSLDLSESMQLPQLSLWHNLCHLDISSCAPEPPMLPIERVNISAYSGWIVLTSLSYL